MTNVNTSLEAVLKISERCNLNCSYCYMFNMNNQSYKQHPKKMSINTMRSVSQFLRNGADEIGVTTVSVVLHGGEPLFMPKEYFEELCIALKSCFDSKFELIISLQTNATLIDKEWIMLFHKHKISISVSIDGYQEIHDKYRIDHKGRGSYHEVSKGIKLLKKYYEMKFIPDIGGLAVINPEADGAKTYRHYVDEFGFKMFNFLLPMDTVDNFSKGTSDGYISFLKGAIDEWIKDDNPDVSVRMFDQFAYFIARGNGERYKYDHYLVSISSNGDISGEDDIKELDIDHTHYNIHTNSVTDFYSSNLMSYMQKVKGTLPIQCYECLWKSYCKGGAQHGVIINRYSKDKGFNNKSVICDVLAFMYEYIAKYQIENGLSQNELESSLKYDGCISTPKELEFLPHKLNSSHSVHT